MFGPPMPFMAGRFNNPMGQGTLSQSAVRTTPLLNFRERREADMKRRASIAGQIGRRAPGDTLIRRGDRKRMQEVQREKMREKTGVEQTNSILSVIQKRFDELTK